ncbi:MAG: microcompartment protein CcmL/EutN [Planctomycetota bacterium]|jgi:microcompartment protein CcmL/EutN
MVKAQQARDDTCLGLIEISSIPRGFQSADFMIKEASIQVLICRAVSPAKYLIVFEGDVESVSRSLARGEETAGTFLVGSLMLPQPHPQILMALQEVRQVNDVDAVGVLESTQVAATLAAADAAAKAAEVEIVEIRLAMGLHGNGFFTMTGEISAVEAALEAAASVAKKRGAWHDQTLIPRPDPDFIPHITDPCPPFSPLPH